MNPSVHRSSTLVRPAALADAPALAELLADLLRRPGTSDAVDDLRAVIEAADTMDGDALLVADLDGEVAGAMYLHVASMSPLNPEPSLHIYALQVGESYRRRGVGGALMAAATAFAEERNITHMGSASHASARDANRFLARLGFGAQVTWRVASTGVVRQKLNQMMPGRVPAARQSRPARQSLGQVVAARRTLRQRHRVG